MLKLHGKDASVYINGVKLTAKAEWSINVTREYVDASVYGDQGKYFYAGLREVSGSFAGFLDADGDGAFTAAKSNSTVTVALYARDTTLVAQGAAYVDIAATANVAEAVRVQATFKGTGTWTLF